MKIARGKNGHFWAKMGVFWPFLAIFGHF